LKKSLSIVHTGFDFLSLLAFSDRCYHPIKYGNQLMTWILLILSVSSVLIGNPFFIFAKRKKKKKKEKKKKKKKEKEKQKRAKRFEIKSPMQ
jgi:hypothetical protein